MAIRMESSSVSSKGSGRAPVSSASAASASSSRPAARTVAPSFRSLRTVAPPIPPLAPVTRTARPLKLSMMALLPVDVRGASVSRHVGHRCDGRESNTERLRCHVFYVMVDSGVIPS